MDFIGILGTITVFGTNTVLTGLAGIFTIASGGKMIYDGLSWYAGLEDVGDELVNSVYKMLDSFDSISSIYDTAQQREDLINTSIGMTEGKQLDPTDSLADLGDLMATKQFKTNEEAMAFDSLLREMLHNKGDSAEQVDTKVKQVLANMNNPEELRKLLKDYGVDNLDGIDGISATDLYNYLFSNKGEIDDAFNKLEFSPEYIEYLDEKKNSFVERDVSIDYNGVLTPEEAKIWYMLEIDKEHWGIEGGRLEYSEVDGTSYITRTKRERDDLSKEVYEYGTKEYKVGAVTYLEGANKAFTFDPSIYETNIKSPKTYTQTETAKLERLYQEEFGENVTMQSTILSPSAISNQSSALAASQTELNSEDLSTIENIDSNILKIYELMAGDSLVGVDGLETQEGPILDSYSKYKEIYGTAGQSDEDISSIQQIQSDLAEIKNTVVVNVETGTGEDLMYPSLQQNNIGESTEQPVQESLTNISTLLSNVNLTSQSELSTMLLNHDLDLSNNLLLVEIAALLNKVLSRPSNVYVTANIYNENDYEKFIDRLTRDLEESINISPEGVYC